MTRQRFLALLKEVVWYVVVPTLLSLAGLCAFFGLLLYVAHNS